MGTLVCLVRGSSAEPYRVSFDLSEGALTAYCTCAAGVQGQACKHRLSILTGDPSAIVDLDPELFAAVQRALPGTPLAAALDDLARAEAGAQAAKSAVAGAKKRLAAVMRGLSDARAPKVNEEREGNLN